MKALTEQIKIARLNTMRARAQKAWHLRCCPQCAEKRAGTDFGEQGGGGLFGLLRAIAATSSAADDEPSTPPKHTH